MKNEDRIILLRRFTQSIEASLAKSKLDANGIPCFLADENLANLYPLQDPRFGVRLYVFEQDADRAREILNEEVWPKDD
ncbi:MAG: DUF2007 domain-containing protein [Cyclobacteriaceae bacterium]|nr:DUF2007 domain-containing protein [Cyclobacteriaceae bacterium]MCX7637119.1 DUF2007 domain-containing protein [Cyclobacteriaceae bacterium]MDW8330028.1 DUF2007 domain-containing protein [Cyclobacteriaceae bacterium]